MFLQSLLVVLPFIANISLGFIVIAQRPRTLQNKLFFVAAVAITVWATSSYMTDNGWSYEVKEFFAHITYGAALLSINALFWFSRAFKQQSRKASKNTLYLLVLGTVLTVLSSTSLVVAGINPTENYTEVLPGPFFVPYLVVLGILFLFATVNIVEAIKHPIDSNHQKQAKHIGAGTGLSFILILISNAIYPAVTGNWSSAALGPLLTVFLVGSITYSMIKHRLFDVRTAIARGLAYLATIASVVVIYLLIILSLSGTNIVSANLSLLQRVVFASIAVFSGFMFQPFKRFFDKITNRLFYRDAYDAQGLLDELNKTLVNTVDLEALLTKASLIIQENMKTTYVTFYIRETSYFDSRIIGAHRKHPEIKNIEKIEETSKHIKRKVHSTDRYDKVQHDHDMNKLLSENEFEVIARLVSTLDYDVEGIGFLFIGHKRSGSQYTKQDLQVLEIIANELVIAVENILRFEEIEQFNVTLQKKIDDATKELKESNAKLRALDEAKDEFVSMASHQLRTPLTSIKGYISMVLEGDAGNINDTQRTMLGQAFFSSQRMVYLISDLLNVSRLKTGKFLIETRPVYLPDLVASEIDQLQEGAKAKNLTLSFVKPSSFATLTLDDMKLRQVVMNFTDNAIYYTPQGGKITVELKESEKSVEFTVKDSGIGVPKEQQHKLFAKFYRADNARKARPDGTGLGLFMAKKVIIAQGGSIIFKSTENKGSTFGFSFPKEKLEVKQTEN